MRRTMPCEGSLEHSESRRTRQQQHERRMTRARYGRARYEIPFPPFSFESIVLYYHDEARHGTGDTRAGDCSLSRLGWVGLGWTGLGKQDGLCQTHIYLLMPTKGDTSVSVTYIRTHVREMDAFYIILNNEYTRDVLVAVRPRSPLHVNVPARAKSLGRGGPGSGSACFFFFEILLTEPIRSYLENLPAGWGRC